MKNQTYRFFAILFAFVLLGSTGVFAQPHSDPAYLQVVSQQYPVVVDGQLTENEWLRRYDILAFGASALPGDINYTVTGSITVKEPYLDSTLTLVYVMRDGLNLYIGLSSNDKSVCKFGTSWEGDGLFMKINAANGTAHEFKAFYNAAGVDPGMVFETNATDPTCFTGADYKKPGTIVNDTTQVDDGYTAEVMIDLAKLGYTDPFAEIPVIINIFDPDGYTGAEDPYGVANGAYFKSWWGSEWGSPTRLLRLADPKVQFAYTTDQAITIDGNLDESFWAGATEFAVGKGNTLSTGGYYAQWNKPLNQYTDQSTANIKVIHKGTDLYIGVVSDDHSVGKWSPGWEADGLFLWITNKGEDRPTERMEIKNQFFDGTIGALASFEVSANVPAGSAEGASSVPAGTVSGTEIGGPDAGFILEEVIHLDYFGYSVGDTVNLSFAIWDIDSASADVFDADLYSDYAPNWWGTQWCDVNFEKYFLYRGIVLSDATDIDENPVTAPTDFALEQNFPNPFNPTTKISYTLPMSGKVSLKVYDVLGNVVSTLVDREQNAGAYTYEWDASGVSSGIYFYTLTTNNFVSTKKMALVK